ncbi:uncharacterized protein LOC122687602 isoform X1 [Cervus elaphus]|uniref:uncharacterized protein LOC122687602 isoform X1 n=1 Tax=Cervus elaphus TaxID=9860 RepID=UPI001CC290B4|nr:uncharacterized protein LOC122687602 isoform X1 [Cervus elaphus]
MQPGDPGQILSLQPLRLCNAVRVSQPAVTLVCFQDQKTLCGKFYITGHAGHMEALQTVFRGWMSLGRPGPQDVGNENVPQMVNRAVSSPCPGCGASWDNHLRVCFTQNRSQRWRLVALRFKALHRALRFLNDLVNSSCCYGPGSQSSQTGLSDVGAWGGRPLQGSACRRGGAHFSPPQHCSAWAVACCVQRQPLSAPQTTRARSLKTVSLRLPPASRVPV